MIFQSELLNLKLFNQYEKHKKSVIIATNIMPGLVYYLSMALYCIRIYVYTALQLAICTDRLEKKEGYMHFWCLSLHQPDNMQHHFPPSPHIPPHHFWLLQLRHRSTIYYYYNIIIYHIIYHIVSYVTSYITSYIISYIVSYHILYHIISFLSMINIHLFLFSFAA